MHDLINDIPRSAKRAIMLGADLVLLPLALWTAFALRYPAFPPSVGGFWWVFLLLTVLTVPVFIRLGLYRAVIRYLGPQAIGVIAVGVTCSTAILVVLTLISWGMANPGEASVPRSVPMIYWLVACSFIGSSRFMVRTWLRRHLRDHKAPVAIYGAGSAGARLCSALAHGQEYEPLVFLDDNRALHGSLIRGVAVHGPGSMDDLIRRLGITHVLLAIPSASRRRRHAIVQRLEQSPVTIRTIPGLAELVAGSASYDEIRTIEIEDLLGRDPVPPDESLLEACIQDKSVMVTGAGGSIGAELCRQIAALGPRRLVLLERSEHALYTLELELRRAYPMSEGTPEIVPVLGSAQDRTRIESSLRAFGVQTVYHAAAYKHVPIVEHNMTEGVRNNILGTWQTAEAAEAAGVEVFVLVSTDKAVRPVSVMGATKRFAEIVLQAIAKERGTMRSTIVRFGNVLGSSGSVVPLFREQIQLGGPVTVTHPDVTRYFMTIEEASQLVIQAGAMGRQGDVLVLEMGEPVRIAELAATMIRLAGREVRDKHHPDGDIEIVFTAMRPGEKIAEELQEGDGLVETSHPMIRRADARSLPWSQVHDRLRQVQAACDAGDCEAILTLLQDVVESYDPADGLEDLVWQACQATQGSTTRPPSVPRR